MSHSHSHSHMPPLLRNHGPEPFTIWDHPFSDKNNNDHHFLKPHMPWPIPVPPLMIHNNNSHNPMIDKIHNNRAAEWHETAETQVLTLEIPTGLTRDQVKVRIKDGKVLKISGKKEMKKEEVHENWQHFERAKGRFFHAVYLPQNSRPDHLTYTLHNGLLTLTLPKMDPVKKSHPKNIHVHG